MERGPVTEFAIGQYGPDDYRIVKWDGDTSVEINGQSWADRPNFEAQLVALFDHHGVGNSPFSSREATIDTFLLANQHVPEIDREAGHPWPWE